MKRKGFTIIEVVLVLAIAGLIFLMVFLALPTLQRNQRDTQRRSNLDRVQAQTTNFMTNNQGRVPNNLANAGCDAQCQWSNFLVNYLNTPDPFIDPSGEPYTIRWRGNAGGAGSVGSENRDALADYEISVYGEAQCNGENAVRIPSGGSRRVAFRMKLEAAGIYCVDNGG
ncbi:type II secretion system GspH family protein [Candidatus Saccharibacteria bacterium]|nr:type II secretion system GspH family protein [Candidatus Saccharibacteria bacterium]